MDRSALWIEKVKQTHPWEGSRGEHRLQWGEIASIGRWGCEARLCAEEEGRERDPQLGRQGHTVRRFSAS